MTGKRYSSNFKRQIFELYQNGQSVAKLSKEYGISELIPKTCTWCKLIYMQWVSHERIKLTQCGYSPIQYRLMNH